MPIEKETQLKFTIPKHPKHTGVVQHRQPAVITRQVYAAL